MPPERKVPVLRSDHSLIDQEFGTIRDRFEAEMRKMEEEMNRFRSQLMEREREFFSGSPAGRLTSSSEPQTGTSNWLTSLDSPLIVDDGDGKCLKLRFDVTDYKPEEIVVKTVDNRLQVHAKHEEKSDNRTVYREYNREFLLPKGTNPELIRSSLSKDGVLTVEAPLLALPPAN